MQTIKEKLNDMTAMRKATAEAKEEEKAEKELAKARMEVAHEVRLAREAEAAMDLHVNKAAEKVAHHEAKHSQLRSSSDHHHHQDMSGRAYSHDQAYGSDSTTSVDSTASTIGSTGYTRDMAGGPANNNIM